mmetsp:Transcript_38953/g.62426  ORF Transcript_38953/g.62426 Transcript_38953/m.62426 type:complete len:108 (-) Transcript_38953:202-525(-)
MGSFIPCSALGDESFDFEGYEGGRVYPQRQIAEGPNPRVCGLLILLHLIHLSSSSSSSSLVSSTQVATHISSELAMRGERLYISICNNANHVYPVTLITTFYDVICK